MTETQSFAKPRHSTRGALVLLPPKSSWEAIDAVRERFDAQIVRWMPHIRLLHPFKEPELFDECLDTVSAVCGKQSPLSFTLSDVRYFTHPSGKGSLWLAPDPMEPLVALQAAFQEAFPQYPQNQRYAKGYTPHVIVGQTRTHTAAQRIALELRQEWTPLPMQIDSVALIGRGHTGPMRVVHEIPLG